MSVKLLSVKLIWERWTPKIQSINCYRLHSQFLNQYDSPFRIHQGDLTWDLFAFLKYRFIAITVTCGVSLLREWTVLLVHMSFRWIRLAYRYSRIRQISHELKIYLKQLWYLSGGIRRSNDAVKLSYKLHTWLDVDYKVGKIDPPSYNIEQSGYKKRVSLEERYGGPRRVSFLS